MKEAINLGKRKINSSPIMRLSRMLQNLHHKVEIKTRRREEGKKGLDTKQL